MHDKQGKNMQKRKKKQELYPMCQYAFMCELGAIHNFLKKWASQGSKHFCPNELKLFPRKLCSGQDNMLVTGHISMLLNTKGT
jgi:hypothetical protein